MTNRRPIRAILSALLCAGAPLITAAPAQAANFAVGCGPDRVAELVAAVDAANANGAGADTITLAAGCTYTLATPNNSWYGPNALPAIASTITVEGNGATIERSSASGTPSFRLFFVGADPMRAETQDYTSPGAGNLTLRNLTVRGGLAKGGDSGRGGGGAGLGGAAFSQGTLNLASVTMTANTAQGGHAGVLGEERGGGGIGTDGSGGNGGGFGAGAFGGAAGGAGSRGGGGGGGLRAVDNGVDAAVGAGGGGGGPTTGTGGRGGSGAGAGNGSGGGGHGVGSTAIGGDGGAFGVGGGFGNSTNGGGGGGGVGGGAGATLAGGTGSSGGGGFGGGGGAGTNLVSAGAGGFAGGGGGGSGSNRSGGFGGGNGGGPNQGINGGGGAGMGGAVFNHQGVLTVTNSTVAANTALAGTGVNPGQGLGGAIFNLNGTVSLTGATVAANTAAQGGGAIYNLVYDKFTARAASVTLVSSILADSAPAGVTDLVSHTPATVADGATNLGTATVAAADHDLVEAMAALGAGTISGLPLTADPGLGALASNEGLTATMAVGISSPAVDKGVTGGLSTDQRGRPRPGDIPGVANTGDGSDIGAYELTPAESQVWVANESANRVTRYAADATGNAAPLASIEGVATGLNKPSGVAVDGSGRLYVANQNAHSITVHAPNATGNAAPLYSISGAGTGLSSPRTLVVDNAGRLYVANAPANTVTVYGPGASGNAAPVATITGLSSPLGVALDAAGKLYVSNGGDSTVRVFNPGATGAAVPALTISAGLSGPQGLVVDTAGVIWVTNTNNNTVTRYSPAGALVDTISGSGLNLPAGIALDASGRVVVSNFSGASLTSFAGTALVNTVVGGATLLAGPIGVAAVPVVTVTTATPLPGATVGTPYSQSLAAAGGTGPYTWALASGSLPAGVSVTSAGVVSGTPSTRGTFAFSVTVTDSAGPSHSTTYAMSLRSRETTTPTCSWSVQNGPRRVNFTVADAGAGLATVVVTTAVNITIPVSIPIFTAGSTAPISFSAFKADQTKSSQVAVVITDVDGNQASCT